MRDDHWDHQSPVRVLFGPGRLSELPTLVDSRALLVTTAGATRRGLTVRVGSLLDDVLVHDAVESNPTMESIQLAIDRWRSADIRQVLAVGGGSAIDVAKVLSLALPAEGARIDAMIEANHPWTSARPLPLIAIPTTAGTGAEVTPFATVWDGEALRKRSIAARHLHPAAAIVDPELALTLPWSETLSTGLDAYSQCFEAICNRQATPITDLYAERGVRLIPDALRTLRVEPTSLAARTAMAEAALLSGLAITHTRTGLSHSMSYPITAHFGVPHGLACALTLPAVLAFNAETDDGRLKRMAAGAGLGTASALAPSILRLYAELGVADEVRLHLRSIVDLDPYREEMLTPGRAENNVRHVASTDLDEILAATAAWFSGGAL